MRVKHAVIVATVAAMVGTGAVAAARTVRSAVSAAPTGANTTRFLALTGDPAARTGRAAIGRPAPNGAPTAVTATAPGRPDCGQASASTPAGWCLTPVGTQYTVLRFPIGLAVDPASGEAIVSSDSGGPQALDVINPNTDPRAAVTVSPGANLFLGLSVTGDGTIYASGGNADRVFRYHLAGPAAVPEDATEAAFLPTHNASNGLQARLNGGQVQAAPASDGVLVGGYPGESVADDAHGLLLVGGTLSEASGSGNERCHGTMPDRSAVPACARVSVIKRGTVGLNDSVAERIAVGADAYGLALDTVHHKLFVANWGDQASRGDGRGTVSVLPVDPTTGMPGPETNVIQVGHHPEAVALSKDSKFLYVTDTNDDQITVIDTATEQHVQIQDGIIDVGTVAHAIGTQPDALAVSPDGGTLFIALAGLNAVQVITLNTSTGMPVESDPTTYIPTGWYPSALAAVSDGNGGTKLWVANAKGLGYGPGFNGSVLVQGTMTAGTVNLIPIPTASATLTSYTNKVIANDGLREASNSCDPSLAPSKVLCPEEGSSPIKHVVYILVENKTFDSYFGDINTPTDMGYNADPKFLLFGQPVTPNQHKVLTDHAGILADNFYSDAEVSVTGHSWAAAALATDHNEKTWQADYDQGVRGTHGNGDPLRPSVAGNAGAAVNNIENALYDPKPGFIFERFVERGAVDPAAEEADPQDNPLSMAIYGEHTTERVSQAYQAKGTQPGVSGPVYWKAGDIQYFDTCRAREFVGIPTGGGNTPNSDQTRDCENRSLDSQFTLKHWEQYYAQHSGVDVMPNFIFMSLPDNHTLGTNLGSPTPQSMVADNDNAIGLMIEALSQSPFWSSTAVVIVQDDTQLTGDHVDPMRDGLEVVSPYSATSPDHQRGSMGSILRTVEMLFDVAPVGVNDKLAAPLHGAFVADPSQAHSLCNAKATLGPDGTYPTSCFTASPELVPFAINQPGAPGQAQSMALDWNGVDHIDMAMLSAIWVATQHHTEFKAPTHHTVSRNADG